MFSKRRVNRLSINSVKQKKFGCSLTHFSWERLKRVIGKQYRPRYDVAECGVLSGSTLFTFDTGISIKHRNNKTNQTPCYWK